MAEIGFTDQERQRIAETLEELGRSIDEFFADVRGSLSCDEWLVLVEYATARMRRVLEVGSSLHAVVDRHEDAGALAGRGRDAFVRAALKAWSDVYAAVPEPWRMAAVFERVPGGEQRVLADVAALEAMAAHRLFESLDDEYERLLGPPP